MRRARILLAALAILLAPALQAQPASESLEKDARAASRAGKFKDAAVKFEQAATAASDAKRRGRLRMQAAYATLNAGNAKGAREALQAAFADDPGLEIVEQLYTPEFRKLWQDVKVEVARAAPPALPDLEELKRTCEERLKDGRYAEVVYDLGKYPQEKLDREAWALLAQAYEKSGRSDQAALARRRALGEAVPITPLPPPPQASASLPGARATPTDLLAFGREALNRGDAATAQAAANRVVEVEPTSSEGYRLLGDSYAARGEKALADAMWRQSLRLNERNEGTLLSLAGLSLESKQFDEALGFLKRAVEVNPQNADRLTALGRKARADGDLKTARQVFAAAAEALPKDVAVLSEYGGLLFQLGDVDAALDPLMRAASEAPDRATVRASLAAAFRKKGQLKDAEREYREALRSDPSWSPALMGLGALLLATDRPADAVAPFRTALAAKPSDPDALLGLARAQRLAGDLPGAAATLQGAASGTDAAALNEAGAVAYAQGLWAEAAALFEKALAAQPGLAEAAANRDRAAAAAQLVATLAAPPPEPLRAPKR
ncbi:MAG: tetratricopeptide repeat protein [Thermoanaerobaculia bacterium]